MKRRKVRVQEGGGCRGESKEEDIQKRSLGDQKREAYSEGRRRRARRVVYQERHSITRPRMPDGKPPRITNSVPMNAAEMAARKGREQEERREERQDKRQEGQKQGKEKRNDGRGFIRGVVSKVTRNRLIIHKIYII